MASCGFFKSKMAYSFYVNVYFSTTGGESSQPGYDYCKGICQTGHRQFTDCKTAVIPTIMTFQFSCVLGVVLPVLLLISDNLRRYEIVFCNQNRDCLVFTRFSTGKLNGSGSSGKSASSKESCTSPFQILILGKASGN